MNLRKSRKPIKVKNLVPYEDQEQIRFANWLRKNNILFAASANGGSRNGLEALKLKRMGVSKGFPDIFIPFPYGEFHGLFIEMKRTKGGVVSSEQKDWIAALNRKGYQAQVCRGFDEAVSCVKNYFPLNEVLPIF